MAKHQKRFRPKVAPRRSPLTAPNAAWLAGAALLGGALVGCSQEPLPTDMSKDRTLSEEVFRILCKRVAKSTHPNERTGAQFDMPCDGQAAPAHNDPRFASMIAHRTETITSLDEFFGRSATLPDASKFQTGELDAFLSSLVPFYDKPAETLPKATRGIATVLAKLVDANDARSKAVLSSLERIGPRKGYRPPAYSLGALRPVLSYPRLDAVGRELLAVLGTDGKGKPAAGQPGLIDTLRGTALELALSAADKESGDSTLDILLRDLLYKPLPGLEGAQSAYIVVRDEQGNAKPASGASGTGLPTPFPVAGEDPNTKRDEFGRALDGSGAPLYEYVDIGRSVFAGLVREGKGLATPQPGYAKSALENLGAGLRAVYGSQAMRTLTFGANNYAFKGADVNASPLFDLAHALAVALRYPETERMVRLFGKLVAEQEDASAAIDRLGVLLKQISDEPEFASAHTVGWDGTPNTPNDVWDDIIGVGLRMLTRPGMFEALIRSFADPAGKSQGKLYGTWMRFSDDVTYGGAPLTPPFTGTGPDGSTGFFTPDQKKSLNTPLTAAYAQPVNRGAPDVGMNRSVWQRTLSLINSLNGKKLCNKKGANLTVGTELLINLKFPLDHDSYGDCELVEIGDALEIYGQSIIKKATITLKDLAAVGLGSVGSPFGIVKGVEIGSPFGKIQETYAQIDGFSDAPNSQSLARFLFAPNNVFMTNLFDPIRTTKNIGEVEIRAFEPNGLFHMEIGQPMADGASLLTAGVPLVAALDSTEKRDVTDPVNPKLTDGYMFGNMLAALHMHWPSRQTQPCPTEYTYGDPNLSQTAGCSQGADKNAPFYAVQSNLVSYEPMLSKMLVDADAVGVLQRSAAVVDAVEVDGKKGLTIVAEFVAKLLAPDPAIAYRDGRKYAATNTCQVVAGGDPACANGQGRIIPQVSPLYLMLDALKGIDQQFNKPENAPKLKAWHEARSAIVDQFLGTEQDGAGKTRLLNQNGRQLGVALSYFGADQLKRHRDAGDLESWAEGLTKRMVDVLEHPITAGTVSVLEALYSSEPAARELAAVTAYLTDAERNPAFFSGILTALADTAEFVSKDPELTPVVQFASLVAAPNAFAAIDGQVVPDAENSAAYAGIEVARAVMSLNKTENASAISRLLKNIVSPSARGEAPVETFFDIVAEVNRQNPLEPSSAPLKAADYSAVFTQIQQFLSDGDRGLERLYKVIQGRKEK
jgi:hypothetical protein